ncbi:MAG: amidohydrolase family protein, partial [Myxococcota bacterium]|nr:amidohydrolase family protein [Myxococcota bacterium]
MDADRRLFALTTLAAIGLAAASAGAGEVAGDRSAQSADLIVHNGVVHTLDPAAPQARALAARDGRIVFVGDDAGALALRGEATRVVDLGGAAVLPGLIDSHAHPMGLGKSLQSLDLVGTRSKSEVVERVRVACDQAPDGIWIYGRGWDQNDWAEPHFPSAADLPPCGDRPVYLARVDGHAYWVNRQALERAGIDATTPDPDGGRIERDAEGRPT